MARTRHKKNSTPAAPSRKAAKPSPAKQKELDAKYNKRLNVVIKALKKEKKRIDPTNRKRVNAVYRAIVATQTRDENYTVNTDAETRKKLKARGFVTNKKGVLIDKPRDGKRELIKGVKTQIAKDGTVIFRAGQRTDYVVGMTKKEKQEYAQDPERVTKELKARLKKLFPTVKKSKSVQIRLQWGIFRGNKTYSPSYFSKRYFAESTAEAIRTHGKRKAPKKIDNLTGLHFVVHHSKTGKKKNAKTNKKATSKKAVKKK